MKNHLQPDDLTEEELAVFRRIIEHRTANIVGYRNLSAEEIELVNEVKRKADEVDQLLKRVSDSRLSDAYWRSIGMIDIQKGFMAVVRSITRPNSF